jgi:hypothetical protein
MTTDEMRAQMETAWAIESETSAAVRALLLLVDKRHAKMIWTMGYAAGRVQGLSHARSMFPTGPK